MSKPFLGAITLKKLGHVERRAYQAWLNQRTRCYNKRCRNYHRYGGRGIRVLYSSRDFISWYVDQFYKKKWHRPSVGRIDHDGDYCFTNIEIQELSDNVKEAQTRTVCGPPQTPVMAINVESGEIFLFLSMNSAAKFAGVRPRSVYLQMLPRKKSSARCGFRFERLEK